MAFSLHIPIYDLQHFTDSISELVIPFVSPTVIEKNKEAYGVKYLKLNMLLIFWAHKSLIGECLH